MIDTTVTAPRRAEAIAVQDQPTTDVTWARFWLGLSVVAMFIITSLLFVVGVAGVHAGADYGLVILIVALIASVVDSVVIAHRRRNR